MSLVALIDHAVLQPTQTDVDVREACSLCADLGAASVCVKPAMVSLATELLAGTKTVPSTVIGFPHGGTSTACKVYETETACAAGAQEVDMVVNIGCVLQEDWESVASDIRAVCDAADAAGALTKVILETGLLPSDAIKRRLCEICERSGAAFVKTSTGFGFVKDAHGALVATGAVEHDVRLMRKSCSSKVQVKASGGIRTFEDAKKFVACGATRIGTSGTEAIACGEQVESRGDY
ncbi:MAG: deoxyribose-phosphate aldolase [Pirellulales bacterium]|nr:deoxyribose-phosphate aldolase [Pirellulales bacterium]